MNRVAVEVEANPVSLHRAHLELAGRLYLERAYQAAAVALDQADAIVEALEQDRREAVRQRDFPRAIAARELAARLRGSHTDVCTCEAD